MPPDSLKLPEKFVNDNKSQQYNSSQARAAVVLLILSQYHQSWFNIVKLI